jgi:hypothetical protein
MRTVFLDTVGLIQVEALRETGTPGFIHSKGRLPRKYDPTHVRASRTLGKMKS